MFSIKRPNIGDYSISYDLIQYNSIKGLINKNREQIGIKIFRIKDFDELFSYLKKINEIDSVETISLQITINSLEVNFFLIIVLKSSTNGEDLEKKFKRISSILELNQNRFLKNMELEYIYLNIFGLSPDLIKNSLKKIIIKTDNNGFFLPGNSKKYFILSEISFKDNDIIIQLKKTTELFFTLKIYGNLIYILNNRKIKTINQSYFFCHHLFPKDFYEKAKNYTDIFKEHRNLFHPLKIGKIILRYPVKDSFFDFSKPNICIKKNDNEKYTKSNICQIDSNRQQLSETVNNNYDLRKILSELDRNYTIYSSNTFLLYNRSTLVIYQKMINKQNIAELTQFLKKKYLFIVLFVPDLISFKNITSQINSLNLKMFHFYILNTKQQLINCLKMINEKTTYQIPETNQIQVYDKIS